MPLDTPPSACATRDRTGYPEPTAAGLLVRTAVPPRPARVVRTDDGVTVLHADWEVGAGRCIPLEFLVDTACPHGFCLGRTTWAALEAAGAIRLDRDLDCHYVCVDGRRAAVERVARGNAVGLPMLRRLGLAEPGVVGGGPRFGTETG